MKNLLIYINPSKEFDTETESLTKIQIDNLLELGWKVDDIILLTNFDYEYNGVKSTVVGDDYFNKTHPNSTKFYAISKMFEDNLIEDHLYWAHDLDCFQKEPISEQEMLKEIDGKDIGICDYGGCMQYAGSSVFFKKSAGDIFARTREVMREHKTGEEDALTALANNNLSFIVRKMGRPERRMIPGNFRDSEYIKNRIRIIDFTYNFWHNNLRRRYIHSKKPIRTLHFDVFYKLGEEGSLFDYFAGRNNLEIDFIGERLTNIFKKYGITTSN